MDTATRDLVGSADPLALLEAGVPLSLLFDLVTIDLSGSKEIAANERADTSWVHQAA
jgi:hypothetical protein